MFKARGPVFGGVVCGGAVFLILCLVFGAPSGAAAQTVRTADELRIALTQASPGATITLAEGDYGRLQWQGAQGVTLRGPATFRGLDLRGARDVRFEGVRFVYTHTAGDPPHLRPFAVQGSAGVTLHNVSVTGDLAENGFPTGYGLSITDSSGITVTDSRIAGFLRGMVVAQTTGVIIAGNTVTGMRSDGLNFAQVRDVQITGNHIHDFNRDLGNDDHADMIQVWTNGTTAPSVNITITGNVLNAGRGAYTQSVFLRNDLVDRGLAGDAMFYRDITIAGNLIINGHTHGITVGETDGLVITGNTVVQNPDVAGGTDNASLWVPRIRVAGAAKDVQITGNLSAGIAGFDGQGDWHLAQNLTVQNTARGTGGYYGTVFGPAAITAPHDPASYRRAD